MAKSKFSWDEEDGEGIIYTPPPGTPAAQPTPPPTEADRQLAALKAEIDKVDAVLAAAGVSLTDAAPASLYVRRDVLNAAEVLSWARKQGLKALVPAKELHVTVCYSRTPIDWMAVGDPWDAEIELPAGGPRVVCQMGDAVVLEFASRALTYRHLEMKEAGASHDYPTFRPHIALSYGPMPQGPMAPYTGRIVLGPEIFEELEDDL